MALRIDCSSDVNDPPTFSDMPKSSFLGQPWIADRVLRERFVLDFSTAGIADSIRVDTVGLRIRHYGIADTLLTSGILGLPLHPALCQILPPRNGNWLAPSSHPLHSVPPSLQKIFAPRHPAEVAKLYITADRFERRSKCLINEIIEQNAHSVKKHTLRIHCGYIAENVL